MLAVVSYGQKITTKRVAMKLALPFLNGLSAYLRLDSISELSLFSDTCAGQNRNQYLICLLLYISMYFRKSVSTSYYIESDYSHMEVDSVHSATEH